MFSNLKYIKYTLKHKIAFLKVEKRLTGRITFRGIFHDFDKLLMYLLMSKEKASSIHRKYSRHHSKMARTEADYLQMVIDWECARETKPDKPLNAYDTLYKYYPWLKNDIEPILIKLNINKGGLS